MGTISLGRVGVPLPQNCILVSVLNSNRNHVLGPFLCKMFPTLADLNLGPKLYHLKITLAHFYPNKVNQVSYTKLYTSRYAFRGLKV